MKLNRKIVIPAALGLALVAAVVIIAVVGQGEKEAPSPDNTDGVNPSPEVTAEAQGNESVTRAEWLQLLTDAMGYSKENDAAGYFSDLSAEHTAYDSVQIAVAYNLLDPAEKQMYPDNPATREFVAVTAAKAMGFFGTPKAELTDISGTSGGEYIRLAVDNELFDCTDGTFKPTEEVTVPECDAVIAKIKDRIAPVFDPNHVDTVLYADGVIDLSKTQDTVTYRDTEAMTVRIKGTDASVLKKGSVYLLPPSKRFPYGVARKVKSISEKNGVYTVKNTVPHIAEVLSKVDIQGGFAPDYENAVWAEGVTVKVGSPENESTAARTTGYSVRSMADTYELPPLDISVAVGSKHVKANYAASLQLEAMVDLDMEFSLVPLNANIKTGYLLIKEHRSESLGLRVEDEAEIDLGVIPFPLGPTGLSINVKLSLTVSGEIALSLVNETQSEFGFSVLNNNPALFAQVLDSEWHLQLEADVFTGFKFAIDLSFMNVSMAEVAALVGYDSKATVTSRSYCLDVAGYLALFVEVSLVPDIKVLEMSAAVHFLTEENSPIRFVRHFEDGKEVAVCTKGDDYSMFIEVTDIKRYAGNVEITYSVVSPLILTEEEAKRIENGELVVQYGRSFATDMMDDNEGGFMEVVQVDDDLFGDVWALPDGRYGVFTLASDVPHALNYGNPYGGLETITVETGLTQTITEDTAIRFYQVDESSEFRTELGDKTYDYRDFPEYCICTRSMLFHNDWYSAEYGHRPYFKVDVKAGAWTEMTEVFYDWLIP